MLDKKVITLFFILIVFLSVGNLFHAGYPLTHDGDVHLLRLTNFYQSLSDGVIIPRWAGNVNYGFGQPVFEFFYPFPSYAASVLHLGGFSFSDSLKILLIAAMVGSGITMFLWLSQQWGIEAGFIAGILYVFAPYRFVDTYVRGDVGESMAFVFIPLALLSLFKLKKSPSVKWMIVGAVSLSLTILSHNVVSLMALPYMLFYGFICLFATEKRKLFGFYFFGLVFLGFTLSAFFWMPGLFEGKYTLRNIVTRGEYAKRFVSFGQILYGSWSYAGTGLFTVQAGIVQWIVLIVSGISVVLLLRKTIIETVFIAGTFVYALCGIFFMLPVSDGIWKNVILLQNFQFPWRFLTVVILGSAILGGYLMTYVPKKYREIVLLVWTLAVLYCNKDYMHARSFINRPDNYFSGIQRAPADTGESSPIWGIRFMEQGYMSPLEVISGKARITVKKRTSIDHVYAVETLVQSRLVENTLYFPGWVILANGQPVPVEFQDQKYRGLQTFSLPRGSFVIEAIFTQTKFRKFAEFLSIISLVAIVVSLVISLSPGRKINAVRIDKRRSI